MKPTTAIKETPKGPSCVVEVCQNQQRCLSPLEGIDRPAVRTGELIVHNSAGLVLRNDDRDAGRKAGAQIDLAASLQGIARF
jgi:hypothetical protein